MKAFYTSFLFAAITWTQTSERTADEQRKKSAVNCSFSDAMLQYIDPCCRIWTELMYKHFFGKILLPVMSVMVQLPLLELV